MKHATLLVKRSSWTPGRWLLGMLISLVLGSIPVCAASPGNPEAEDVSEQITFQDGKLTARIVRAPLRQMMEEISRLSGVQVRWLDAEVREQAVSVEFTALSLPEAIRRILSTTNFLLVSTAGSGGTQLAQIWIAARGDGIEQPAHPRQTVAHVQPTPSAGEAAPDMEPPHEAEHQTSLNTAQAAPDVQQAPEALLQLAMSAAELGTRLHAIESVGRYAREDPRVRAVLADLAHNDANPQVRDVASMVLGERE